MEIEKINKIKIKIKKYTIIKQFVYVLAFVSLVMGFSRFFLTGYMLMTICMFILILLEIKKKELEL